MAWHGKITLVSRVESASQSNNMSFKIHRGNHSNIFLIVSQFSFWQSEWLNFDSIDIWRDFQIYWNYKMVQWNIMIDIGQI